MDEDAIDLPLLQQWIGRSEQAQAGLESAAAVALAATLGCDGIGAGTALPPLWHWLYFWPAAARAELGEDGHPARGGFLPPVPLPRRMWAGGRLRFEQDLVLDAAASRTSRIGAVTAKQGASGPLLFVKVEHRLEQAQGLCLVEQQELVYRPAQGAGTAAPAPALRMAPSGARWCQRIEPDPVLLFRYSALTFNGHRIHYDRDYAREVEGYPALVVHGPLIATLLAGLLRQQLPGAVLASFDFRALAPLFDHEPFFVCGAPGADGRIALWAHNARGELAMQAEATLAAPFHVESESRYARPARSL